MRTIPFERGTAGAVAAFVAASCLVACAMAGAAAAQERHVSPWYGPAGIRPIPLGQGQSTVLRGAFHEAPFIRHIYRGFLGREPSQDEVRAWGRDLGKETGPTGLVRYFMESDEYFVRQAYLGLLRREPDPFGRDAFSRLLHSGGSRADVVESILWSDEFRRLAPETQAPPPPPASKGPAPLLPPYKGSGGGSSPPYPR